MGTAGDALYLVLFDALVLDAWELYVFELIQESAFMWVLAQLTPFVIAHSICNIILREVIDAMCHHMPLSQANVLHHIHSSRYHQYIAFYRTPLEVIQFILFVLYQAIKYIFWPL